MGDIMVIVAVIMVDMVNIMATDIQIMEHIVDMAATTVTADNIILPGEPILKTL